MDDLARLLQNGKCTSRPNILLFHRLKICRSTLLYDDKAHLSSDLEALKLSNVRSGARKDSSVGGGNCSNWILNPLHTCVLSVFI